MKRGRPRGFYPTEEFLTYLIDRRQWLKLSLATLERNRINRGTLSQVLHGKRPLSQGFREALIDALHIESEEANRLLRPADNPAPKPDLILLDPPTSPHPPLDQGQRFLICGIYPAAIQEFTEVFRAADSGKEHILRADAAARIAWAHFEMGLDLKSAYWVKKSITLIEQFLRAPSTEIIESLEPGSSSALCTPRDEAAHVLSRALQIRYKTLVESILYPKRVICDEHEQWRLDAGKTFAQMRALDERIRDASQFGHDLRWQAVFLASGAELATKEAQNLLMASAEKFPQGSLGAAYLARDRGVVCWLSDNFRGARRFLLDSVQALSSFADSRALGPAFCALSKVTLQSGADRHEARRFALAGAALHPYGFVLENAKEQFKEVSEAGLRRDIDDLYHGYSPFGVVAPVLSRLTEGSRKDVEQRIKRNLSWLSRIACNYW